MLQLYEIYQRGPYRSVNWEMAGKEYIFAAESPERAIELAKQDPDLKMILHKRRQIRAWPFRYPKSPDDEGKWQQEVEEALNTHCKEGRVMMTLSGNPFKGMQMNLQLPDREEAQVSA